MGNFSIERSQKIKLSFAPAYKLNHQHKLCGKNTNKTYTATSKRAKPMPSQAQPNGTFLEKPHQSKAQIPVAIKCMYEKTKSTMHNNVNRNFKKAKFVQSMYQAHTISML